MSDEWFVERKSGISGPYTGARLKALAAEGRVRPSDLIRKGTDGKPVSASRVKGLFPTPIAKLPSSPPSPSTAQQNSNDSEKDGSPTRRTPSWVVKTPVVVVMALVFPPVGLFLIWLHPTWKKTTKFCWTAASFGMFFIYLLADNRRPHDSPITSEPSTPAVVMAKQGGRPNVAQKAELEVLAEDFLPHEHGRKLEYTWIMSPSKPPSMLRHYTITDRPDGWSEEHTLSARIRGTDELVPWPDDVKNRQQRRLRAGFIEVGGDNEPYSPEIKIGAKKGDSWTNEIPNVQNSTFTVAAFRHQTVDGQRRLTAVIIEATTAGSVKLVVTKEYAKGVGLIFHACKNEKGDLEGAIWALASLGLDSDPGQPHVEDYLAEIERGEQGQANRQEVVGQRNKPTDPDEVASPIPGFPKVDYSYDFSKDDFAAIPAGATRRVREDVRANDDNQFPGKPETIDGYVDASGKFVFHGTFVTWNDDSKRVKLLEGTCLHGQLHGVIASYYPNGRKKEEETDVHGKPHGRHRCWYPNGQLSIDSWYFNGQQHGVRKEWYDNGDRQLEVVFIHGAKQPNERTWPRIGAPPAMSGCDLFLKRIAQLQGMERWEYVDKGSSNQSIVYSPLPAPASFASHKLHWLHLANQKGPPKQHLIERVFKAIGVPSQRLAKVDNERSSEVITSEVWIYELSDGEIRIAVTVLPSLTRSAPTGYALDPSQKVDRVVFSGPGVEVFSY